MPVRYESIPRDDDVDDGLAARVWDPLWLLCRQWQFGEFRGQDAGSITAIETDVETSRLDSWQAGPDAAWQPYDPMAEPLERLAEQEPTDPAADPQLRTHAGVRLIRLLAAASLPPGPWLHRYAFTDTDPDSDPGRAPRPLAALIRARVPDGARAAAGLRLLTGPDAQADTEAAALQLSAQQRGHATALAKDWLAWWDAHTPPGPPAAADPGDSRPATWHDDRLEYTFAVRASSAPGTELCAAEFPGGRLDWWSLDAAATPRDNAATPRDNPAEPSAGAAAPDRLTLRGIPTPAQFGGMPAARFWEMEDAVIDVGSIDAAPHDLGRLLMVSFATVYSNDWYVVPVRLPIGTLSRVDRFTVTDVFGGTEDIDAAGPGSSTDSNAASSAFQLFRLTDTREPGGASPWFLLAPALCDTLGGPALESVLIARDEMANLAWAIEQRIQDAAGSPLDRYDTMIRPAAAPPETIPAYRVDTHVPDHWYPLIAQQLPDLESVALRLVPLARRADPNPGDGPPGEVSQVLPLGQILAAARSTTPFLLHEEEAPRSGVAVTRSATRTRWHDGSVHTWTARRRASGTGESASGLRFDQVAAPAPQPPASQ
jgi:hypothetical protein